HYLLACPATADHRRATLATLGRNGRSLSYLLSHPKGIPTLFKFIARTRRFTATYGDL
ncbi:hypothetical protein FB107DRAFT_173251, partial [Schizophyllum commune]